MASQIFIARYKGEIVGRHTSVTPFTHAFVVLERPDLEEEERQDAYAERPFHPRTRGCLACCAPACDSRPAWCVGSGVQSGSAPDDVAHRHGHRRRDDRHLHSLRERCQAQPAGVAWVVKYGGSHAVQAAHSPWAKSCLRRCSRSNYPRAQNTTA
jgi:hypothetical protein